MFDAFIDRSLRRAIGSTLLAASAARCWPQGAEAATRIKEVATVQGVRANQLVGYDTGEGRRCLAFVVAGRHRAVASVELPVGS